ncbi:MAG: DUF929 family protein [Trebonia sp.]
MSEQDDADVIEQAPRRLCLPVVPGLATLRGISGTGRRRLVIAVAFALLVTVATLVTGQLTRVPRTDPGFARLITEVTTVPVGKSVPGLSGLPASALSASASAAILLIGLDTPHAVSGPPLALDGKPEVLYIAEEDCPYCAMENWPLIVALGRFGNFTGLTTSQSPEFEDIAQVDSWTFFGSRYTSPYLSLAPVERRSNDLVNAKANPDDDASYRVLQRLTPTQQAIFARYDKTGSTPFLDFGGNAVRIGSGAIPPQLMTGKSWQQLAAALRQPKTEIGAALLDEADVLTAQLCRLTDNRPGSACPAFLTNTGLPSLEPGHGTGQLPFLSAVVQPAAMEPGSYLEAVESG